MMRILQCLLKITNVILLVQTGASTRPKIFTPHRRDTKYIPPSGEVQLQCEARGHPQPRYTWLKDEKELLSTSSIEMNSLHGNLTINDFRSSDEGRYACRAENVDGIAVSPDVSLIEAKLSHEWDVPLQEKSITEGDPVSFRCRNPPLCVPTGEFIWHKDQTELRTSERIQIDRSGTLHFAYTEKDDAGGYRCKIYNSKLEMMKLGSPATLKIKHNTGMSAPDFKPQLESDVYSRVALLDTELRLECIFSGKPAPKINWMHNGVHITLINKKYSSDGGVLTIKNVDVTDAGTYTCTAVNAVGTETGEIHVYVKSGPIWVEAPNSQVVLEGEDANFTCKATSVGSTSPLHIAWLHELTPVNDSRLTVSENKSTLTIHSVKMGDNDCVWCNVSNDIDYIWKDACLRVVNDTKDLPQTTTSAQTADVTEARTGSTGGLETGLAVVVVLVVILSVVVGVVIWKRQKKDNHLTVLRVKDPNDDFAEKAKRRQTV